MAVGVSKLGIDIRLSANVSVIRCVYVLMLALSGVLISVLYKTIIIHRLVRGCRPVGLISISPCMQYP